MSTAVHDAVMADLKGCFKEIPLIKIPTDNKQDSLKEERQSLKSARKTRDGDQAQDEIPKKEAEDQVTVWMCDICQRPNNLLEGADCLYQKGKELCQGNL